MGTRVRVPVTPAQASSAQRFGPSGSATLSFVHPLPAVHASEVVSEARAEALRSVKNGMCVRRGEGSKGRKCDGEGQFVRKEEFERLCADREIEWAREDAFARLDAVALQVVVGTGSFSSSLSQWLTQC
jgi:hypothetical protein